MESFKKVMNEITTIKIMILTESNLHALGSYNGVGWNKKQLTQLGISWPPPNGWLKKLVGTEIDTNKYEMAMSLRNIKDNQYKSKETASEHSSSKQHTLSNKQYIDLLKRCKAELMFPLDELTEVRMNIINEIDIISN